MNKIFQPQDLFAGHPASMSCGSDVSPGSVERVEGNIAYVRADDYRVVSGSVQDGSAEYEYSANPDGALDAYRFRNGKWEAVYKNPDSGRWVLGSRYNRVGFGGRRRYYDPHF